jgi:hypothetical protein
LQEQQGNPGIDNDVQQDRQKKTHDDQRGYPLPDQQQSEHDQKTPVANKSCPGEKPQDCHLSKIINSA